MIVASVDFETTGVHIVNDRPIEFGGVLYSTTKHRTLDSVSLLVQTDKEITSKVTEITGIVKPMLDRFGYDEETVFDAITEMIENADAVIGYNVRRFDKYIYSEMAKRLQRNVPDKLWIDLFCDLPWTVPMGKLSHVAADHGLLNLFPHSALADAQIVIAILEKYDDKLIHQRAQSPTIVLRSLQKRNENDLVKEAPFKFRWNPPRQIWWRQAKEQDVDEIVRLATFPISVEKELTVEELDQ